MKNSDKTSRRNFLVGTSSAALAAAVPVPLPKSWTGEADQANPTAEKHSAPYTQQQLFAGGPQRTFSGEYATQVAMPVGGIGAGCVCFNGNGGLQDFSVRNRPVFSALPEDGPLDGAGFALLHIKGKTPVTKLVEGPLPVNKIYDQGLQGQGLRRGGFEGFPRFAKCIFQGEFPFGEAKISDPNIPLHATVTAWNPFIPLDDKNSGIPCAILEYTFHNVSGNSVDYEFSYHLSHLAPGCADDSENSRNSAISERGAFLFNADPQNAESFGSASLIALQQDVQVKAMWLRSPGWEFDSLSALWREVSSGTFTANSGTNGVDTRGRNGASILFAGTLAPGQKKTHALAIAWHFPNGYIAVGNADASLTNGMQGQPGCRTFADGRTPLWRPYYAGVWKDAREVALYVSENYESLRTRTTKFQEALFASTLPAHLLDAISANLGILKSPTVLRLENGDLWGWEGCATDGGCGHGSCTHVWNYAQAFANLFPKLERTLREQELERSMDERGHVTFRAALPEGPPKHDFHAASDGQFGGIAKVYRDWQISGDTEWMKKLYPLAKRSLDYCIQTWDPDKKGGLFEPHHNTYDIEFWGPDGMCTSIYLAALSAFAEMAKALGKTGDANTYGALAKTCAQFLDQRLYNGEYYEQKVQYEGLRNKTFAEMVAKVTDQSSEMQRLLKREGPKYQYGKGCISDGVIGAWMAKTYGIATPLAQEHVRSALKSIFRYNFRPNLWQHANAQRPGYALGEEAGLLLSSWPRGGKPTLPFVYSDEVWTGIEYQVAAHLISEGFVNEGLTIVKALRQRYDGRTRNPWNEYEYGSYYTRAMASYALLGAMSGFRYSAVTKTLWFGPRVEHRPFRTFFSAASGFGTISLDANRIRVELIEGQLELETLVLTTGPQPNTMDWKVVAKTGSPAEKKL